MKNSRNREDTWVCNYCGSDDIYETSYVPMNSIKLDWNNVRFPKNAEYFADCCDDFEHPLLYQEWEELIIEECNGNKDKYIAILDGSRA